MKRPMDVAAVFVLAVGASFASGCTHSVGGTSEALGCLDQATYCYLDDLPPGGVQNLKDEGCWITGGGHLGDADARGGAGRNNQDSFGFNAMGMKDGRVRGELQNTTHLGDVLHGQATWIRCWRDAGPGPEVPRARPNNAQWGGLGSWNHADGYFWTAHLADRAEGGSRNDEYELWVWSSGGELVYSQTAEDDLVIAGGNFQIHPPNNGHPYQRGEMPEGAPQP